MKAFQLFIAVIFLTVGFSSARAQLCGTWTYTVSVFDAKDAPVKNAKVEFKNAPAGDAARGRKFIKSGNVFTVEFSEGEEVSGKYDIKISAKGYVDLIQKVEFEYCRKAAFRVVLKARPEKPRTYV